MGTYTVTLSYRDTYENPAGTNSSSGVVVNVIPFSYQVMLTRNGTLPAGVAGIPPDSIWVSFGHPSINEAGQGVMLATYKAGAVSKTGIFTLSLWGATGTLKLLARKGDPVPGIANAVLSSIKDPLLAPDGAVAWLATLANAPGTAGSVTTADNAVIMYDADGSGSGSPVVIGRKGAVATGATAMAVPPGVNALPEWNAFTSVALGNDSLAFMAKLTAKTSGLPGAPGPGGVTLTNDAGLWVFDRSSSSLALAVREGDVLLGSTVTAITALVPRPGSPGQGRGTTSQTVVRVALEDGRRAVGQVASNGALTLAYETGGSAPAFNVGALWKSFGSPTQNDVSGALAFIGTVQAGTGGATSANNLAIFAEDDVNFAPSRVVTKGDLAAGVGAGAFAGFQDPVSAGGRNVAFMATLKANATSGIDGTNNQGIWHSDDVNGLQLVAREGALATEAPVGAKWKKLNSLALPEGRGPIFVATMHSRIGLSSPGPGGVTTATDVGLWMTDGSGTLRLVLREGDEVLGHTVKNFVVLPTVVGSPAQTRSFDSHGNIVVRMTDTFGQQHLLLIALE